MKWIAAPALALTLAASLLAGCDEKAKPHTSAGSQPAAPPGASGAPAPAAPASTAPPITSAETIRRLTDVADQICACKDRACAEAAYAALQAENQKLAGRARATPTQAEADAMRAQAQRLSGCINQLP